MVGTRSKVLRVNDTPYILQLLKKTKTYAESFYITKLDIEDILHSNCGISPSSVMFKANKLESVGGFDEGLGANQGRDLFIRFVSQYGTIARINERLVIRHRDHEYDRISESAGSRLEALDFVHKKYKELMSPWLERYDRARIALLRKLGALCCPST